MLDDGKWGNRNDRLTDYAMPRMLIKKCTPRGSLVEPLSRFEFFTAKAVINRGCNDAYNSYSSRINTLGGRIHPHRAEKAF